MNWFQGLICIAVVGFVLSANVDRSGPLDFFVVTEPKDPLACMDKVGPFGDTSTCLWRVIRNTIDCLTMEYIPLSKVSHLEYSVKPEYKEILLRVLDDYLLELYEEYGELDSEESFGHMGVTHDKIQCFVNVLVDTMGCLAYMTTGIDFNKLDREAFGNIVDVSSVETMEHSTEEIS